MDFLDEIKQFIKRLETIKDNLSTEEATKTALIMPLFQILEYDIFNPLEFVPEFTADVGVKKGEKVDYAIMEDGKPLILIEAKPVTDKLRRHNAQLFRYFTATEAKFAILTNGITYKFFTDLEEKNIMDDEPFLTIDLLNSDDNKLSHLKKFSKSKFDLEDIFSIASELKYTSLIKAQLNSQLNNPSDEFVRFIISDFYSGIKTANVVEKFRPIVKRSIYQFVNDFMSEKLKGILETENNDESISKVSNDKNIIINNRPSISITDDELQAFNLIKDISEPFSDIDDVTYIKVGNELNIIYKNDPLKLICKTNLNFPKKTIFLPDAEQGTLQYFMDEVIDIKELKDQIAEIIKSYCVSSMYV